MATTRQYWNQLKATRDQICIAMGTLPASQPADRRALSDATLATVAIVVKALADAGAVTDAEMTAARAAALTDTWDVETPTP